jgi:tripartite-type tricarboxylate transporter receptor subunit TctC
MIRFLAVAALACVSANACAQYPDKPIKLIVPWATGGSTDTLGRTLAQRLSQTLGQQVVVDNRPGAAAAIGTDAMAKAAPDGYTLGMIELPHAIAPSVVAKLPYDLQRDLQPIALIGTSPLLLLVSTTLPAKSINDFVNAAKAQPGGIAIAHSGNGSVSHLAAELLQEKTGTKFTLASYKGSGPALIDLAGGHVQAHFVTLAGGNASLKSGKAAALGVAAHKRVGALPDVATFAEGNLNEFVVEQWWGVVAPKGTPAAIVEKLRAEIVAAVAHATLQDRMRELAVDPRPLGPEPFAAFIDSEMKRWGAVVKKAGIKPE